MGLFDGWQFDPATFAPQGGLLGQLAQWQQLAQAPAASKAGPSGLVPDYGQTANVVGSLGPYAVPTFGQADQAALPQNAQPAQYQQQQEPSFLDRLSAAGSSFVNSQGLGLVPAISGFATGKPVENQTVKALVAKGLDPALAETVARDPGALRAVLPALVGGGQTNNMKDFVAAQQNPAYQKFLENMKKAGAQNISVDQRGENAFAKTAGETQAKRYSEIAASGLEAQSMISDINALRDIGSRITTGKGAEIRAALGPYADALGVKIEGLDDLQAYKAVIAKLTPRMRVPGSGATSDFEMKTFLEALPGLGKTPGGNEIVTNTLEAMSQHRVAAAEIASKALSGEISPRDAEDALRKLPDPLTLWKKQGKSLAGAPVMPAPSSDGLPRMQSVQDALKLKPGTRFLDANGVERIR